MPAAVRPTAVIIVGQRYTFAIAGDESDFRPLQRAIRALWNHCTAIPVHRVKQSGLYLCTTDSHLSVFRYLTARADELTPI